MNEYVISLYIVTDSPLTEQDFAELEPALNDPDDVMRMLMTNNVFVSRADNVLRLHGTIDDITGQN